MVEVGYRQVVQGYEIAVKRLQMTIAEVYK